jgi:hypothetical protein
MIKLYNYFLLNYKNNLCLLLEKNYEIYIIKKIISILQDIINLILINKNLYH